MDFDDDFFEFLLYLEENPERAPRRFLRDMENPLHLFDDRQFIMRYRFSKQVVTDVILPLVGPNLQTTTGRGMPVSPLLKVLSVLRFYATGSYQIVCGDLCGISQPTVCQTVKKISFLLALQLPRFVQLPNEGKFEAYRRRFYHIAHFPLVVGCIDCTHIPIINPNRQGREIFRNRKGYFSLNVQVVGGPQGEILDIVIRWPGSVHDSRIFDNSSVKIKFESNQIQGLLLGDSGYSHTKYLFTPLANPQTDADHRYNNAHTSTRQCVERLFGIWKKRFSCLSKKLGNKMTTTVHIISACAVLHNISIQHKENNLDELFENNEPNDIAHEPVGNMENMRGAVIKRAFIAQHFQ